MAADRSKTIAFKWGADTYVFSAGQFSYTTTEDREDWQYSNGVRNYALNWVDLQFQVSLGYLDQQLNGGKAYSLQDGSQIAAAPAVGLADVLNALKDSNITAVEYYPILEDNAGNVWLDNYEVLTLQADTLIMQAQRAGRFTPHIPVTMIVKDPLTEYPAWANR